MELKRLRIRGIKDGSRVYIDLQGPELMTDPEISVVRELEDIETAARDYLDTIIDIWVGPWESDQDLQQQADGWNHWHHSKVTDSFEESEPDYDIAAMREMEADDFVSHNAGSPWDWEEVLHCLKNQKKWLHRGRHREYSNYFPATVLLCRDCLKPSRWIWHECFPGPTCGSAGWVAICEDCKTWHKERTCVIS